MAPKPNLEFSGETYVAFSDLSGFKEALGRSYQRGYEALSSLYNAAYECLADERHRQVAGFAISDCVVSWSSDTNQSQIEKAETLFSFLKELHSNIIIQSQLITTTVAWGEYVYQRRLELPNLRKGMLCGSAYVAAYLANAKAEPGAIVLLSSKCRIDPTKDLVDQQLWRKIASPRGWEYFWSINHPDEIRRVIHARARAYNYRFERLKRLYRGQLDDNQLFD